MNSVYFQHARSVHIGNRTDFVVLKTDRSARARNTRQTVSSVFGYVRDQNDLISHIS